MAGQLDRRTAILGVALGLMALAQWAGVDGGTWADSDVYRAGGRALLDSEDIYDRPTENDLYFTYPPFAALLASPLALASSEVGRAALTAASVAGLLAAVALLGSALRLPRATQVVVILSALAIEPTLRTLVLGQVNLILIAMVLLDVTSGRRTRGVLIGIAAGVKLTPAAFVLVLVLQRDWRSVARAAVAFLVTAALGFVAAPASSVAFWIEGGIFKLNKFGDDALLGTDNQSLLGAVLRLTSQPHASPTLSALLFVVGIALGVSVAAAYRHAGRASDVPMTGAVAIGALLASPVSWSHHWCSAVILVAILLAARRPLAAGLVSGVLWFPFVWLTYTDVPFGEVEFSLLTATASVPYVVVGLACLTYLWHTAPIDGTDIPPVHGRDSHIGLTQSVRSSDP